MKNFDVLGVHWKIRLLRGGGEFKNGGGGGGGLDSLQIWGGGGEGGLARKRVVVFLRGGWYPNAHYGKAINV